jgi:5'(3')-deoxyribonucleotidase
MDSFALYGLNIIPLKRILFYQYASIYIKHIAFLTAKAQSHKGIFIFEIYIFLPHRNIVFLLHKGASFYIKTHSYVKSRKWAVQFFF